MTFVRFFYEFLSIAAGGIVTIFSGLFNGIKKIFSIKSYKQIINNYKADFNGPEWVLTALGIAVLVIVVALIGLLLWFIIKKYARFRKTVVEQESLLDEIGDLNDRVTGLVKENERILAMKVSQIGLKPGESPEEEVSSSSEGGEDSDEDVEFDENMSTEGLRFPQLTRLDRKFAKTKIVNFGNTQSLPELLDDFRCFAASKLHLYYNEDLLRVFFSGLACGKMIILQGISGTGKTSLAYAWSKFNKSPACISSVQPSWRDRADFFGYLNEFTKKFNETPALVELYASHFDDRIHTIVLDEMNLARVEYYFAEALSILEMPVRSEWQIALVNDRMENDPKRFLNGKLLLPPNIWYIGTINNDDSTFMVTDKVYDRAMPIDINTKVAPFDCREQDALDLNSSYLDKLFAEAIQEHPITDEMFAKIEKLDDYVIKHFRVAFGNRIMKQLKTFVAVYVACGGEEVAAVDYFVAKKILRKFEQLNIAYIRDEFDPFIQELNQKFGDNKMVECIDYCNLLKKG